MADDFQKYEQLYSENASPEDAYLQAEADGLSPLTRIRMLTSVFKLNLEQAKKISVTADRSSNGLIEHQAKLLPALKELVETDSESVDELD